LELVAVVALAWWLADIQLARDQRGRHVGIVLDDRVRLQAHLVGGTTPAEQIRAQLATYLASLRFADRVTVVASGAVPRLMAGPAATPEQALAAVAGWVPAAPWHELDPAIDLIQQITAQMAQDGGDVLIASDRIPTNPAPGLGWIATGMPLPASGLADVRWLRNHTGERLVVRITASGVMPARRLEVRLAERVVASVPIAGPGTILIPLTPGALASEALKEDERLTVVLTGDDPFPADDTVLLQRPVRRVVHVALTLPEPTRTLVARAMHGVPDIAIDTLSTATDLVISNRDECPPGAWLVRIAPAAGSDAVLGPYLMRRGHPLVRDLDGTGLLWIGGVSAAALPVDAEPLISAGSLVLVSERRRARDRLVTLHVEPTAGTLITHPLWPSLIANVIEARRATLPGVVDPNRPANQPTSLYVPSTVTEVQVLAQGAHESTTLVADADGMILVPPLGVTGAWQIQAPAALLTVPPAVASTLTTLMVHQLDERMGDFVAASTRSIEPTVGALVAVERRRSPAERLVPLLLAAFAALTACWLWTRGR